jgi:DNA replication and repair protein RecF
MNILSLKFSHFRNYEKAEFFFEPGKIHILTGANAQGKTNLVESVFFLSFLRSFRTSKLEALAAYGSSDFQIRARIEKNGRQEDIQAGTADGKKKLFRYGQPVSSSTAFVGTVNAVLFCPDDLNLFTQSPALRRKFADMELVKMSKTYTATLSRYQKLLKLRNAALKLPNPDPSLCDVYVHQMAADEAVIIAQRQKFIEAVNEKAAALYPIFSDGKEKLEIQYNTFVDVSQPLSEQILACHMAAKEREKRPKTTAVGIHKDDLAFYLDSQPVALSASQGQRRSVLLALKLALCYIAKEKTGEWPILLLDDVFSELDEKRRQRLAALLPENMQIFITTAEPIQKDWFAGRGVFYTVENNQIRRMNDDRIE